MCASGTSRPPPPPFSFILCRLAIETSLAKSQETKNSVCMSLKCVFSFSLYFLILCRLVFLFYLFCAVWLSKQVSPNRRRRRIHFLCLYTIVFCFFYTVSAQCESDLEIKGRFGETCFDSQTAQNKENKKTSQHKIRKYKENEKTHFKDIQNEFFVSCDLARLVSIAKLHKIKKIKRLAGTK